MADRVLALTGARIFDGHQWHDGKSLIVRNGLVEAISSHIPAGAALEAIEGTVAPGFVDLQVNGGGGVMLNDHPDVGTIRTICDAHRPFGTTALLATLITDKPEKTAAAIEAGADAHRQGVPGFLGLHLEGPYLSVARKGAHDPSLIRPMTQDDLAGLVAAKANFPVLLATLAPESATPDQVRTLTEAGVVVSLGHTDATYSTARSYADAGATMATHLFNAMSPLGSREPGMAGAAIALGAFHAGLIADGIHVDAATIGIALRAKRGPGRIFLVTDAMATLGSKLTQFQLNGRTIHRRDGRLTLADGTLAGADLDMISAVRFMHKHVGIELGEALRMASLYPAEAVGVSDRLGSLRSGARADFINLGPELDIRSVWIDGLRE